VPPFRPAKSTAPRLHFDPTAIELVKERARGQATMTRGSSPLYTAIIEHFLAWIGDPNAAAEALGDAAALISFCNRFVEFVGDARWTYDLEPCLRLGAALHWYVLGEDARVATIRPYYCTVGGSTDVSTPEFATHLLAAVDGLGELLFERAREWPVQTNETSRGLAWLLPAVLVGIDAAHLLEFGASAGLNLYAEQRRYDLVWENGSSLTIGRATSPQFEVKMHAPEFEGLDAATLRGPEVISRVGGDQSPVLLASAEATRRLEACVWGDHCARLDRLREGIAVHRQAVAGELSPLASIVALQLPDDIGDFLAAHAPSKPSAPVISFNTVVTTYLNDVDQRAVVRTVREFARRWSVLHQLPWMWVRFEPVRPGEAIETHRGWCRWFVELFEGTSHRVLDIGWAHPHLREVDLSERVLELRKLGAN
jgi:hypothetical protein